MFVIFPFSAPKSVRFRLAVFPVVMICRGVRMWVLSLLSQSGGVKGVVWKLGLNLVLNWFDTWRRRMEWRIGNGGLGGDKLLILGPGLGDSSFCVFFFLFFFYYYLILLSFSFSRKKEMKNFVLRPWSVRIVVKSLLNFIICINSWINFFNIKIEVHF